MFKRHLSILFLLIPILTSNSQITSTVGLSKFSKISIITSGPGDKLYEKFGHTAIRVKDPVLQLDLIYNYGIFDFDDPNFILNFTKGYMKYKLARYPFYLALQSTQDEKRWMKEQVLNLTKEQRNSFFSYLEINAAPKNASYLYDPFFDNCATKPRDIITKVLGENLIFKHDFVSEKLSLRQLMNKEIHQNTWGSLGINIALGNRLDKIAAPTEYLYLPDYVFEGFNKSKVKRNGNEENLISKTTTLLNFKEKESKGDTIAPFWVLLLIAVLGIFITYKDYVKRKRNKWLDFSILFTTGVFGVLILFLWFFTNHSTAPNNFNFLWAFAPNLFVAFLLFKRKQPKWIKMYFKVIFVLLCSIPILWITKIQLFSYVLIPFFIFLGIRYWFLHKTLNR